jgi:hypothetical protein
MSPSTTMTSRCVKGAGHFGHRYNVVRRTGPYLTLRVMISKFSSEMVFNNGTGSSRALISFRGHLRRNAQLTRGCTADCVAAVRSHKSLKDAGRHSPAGCVRSVIKQRSADAFTQGCEWYVPAFFNRKHASGNGKTMTLNREDLR